MPGMSTEVIIKAPVFKRLSDQSRVAGFDKSPLLANIISDLKAGAKSLVDIALGAGMYADSKQAEHFDKDWLNSGGTGFWSKGPYKVPDLVRGGIIKALEVYQSTGKPLDFFWMLSGTDKADPWKVIVAEAADTIVVIFFTPDVPCGLKMIEDYSMWVTEQDGGGNVATRHTKRPVE
jgi:hypothetical protein